MPSRTIYTGTHRKLILGFDVGTTFSGISYSLLEPGKVGSILPVTRFPPQPLVGGDSKVPSIAYYDNTGAVKAVGAEAMEESARERAEAEGWVKASWFKLHMRPGIVTLPRPDVKLVPLPANTTTVDIFTDFLRYLLKCARTYISEHYPNGAAMWVTLEDTMEFVITHPNGWEGEQQAKLRAAAIAAGLVPDTPAGHGRVYFVTEGEASLNFCILNGLATDPLNEGKGVVIVDAGGGTVDISAYRKTGDSFEEIAPTACLMDGSVFVTKNCRDYLDVFLRNSKYHPEVAEIAEFFDQSTKLKFRNASEFAYIRFGTLRDKDPAFNITNGQMKLPGTVVAKFFEPSVDAIVQAVEKQCASAKAHISSVFLVGGFAASEWLFSQLQQRLGALGLDVSRPDSHVNKAVSDGAVSFYLDHFVSARVAKDTYGIEHFPSYQAYLPDHSARSHLLLTLADGQVYVPNGFSSILPRGTTVSETQEFRSPFRFTQQSRSELCSVSVDIRRYQGNQNPKWIDVDKENHTVLCTVHAETYEMAQTLKPLHGRKGVYYVLPFEMVFSFGKTELTAQIAWKENGVEKRSPAEILYERSG